MTRIGFGCFGLGALALSVVMPAQADEPVYYGSLSGGVSFLSESDNSGAFNGDFTTGAGTTIPAGTVLPDGTPVGWTTEFDPGFSVGAALGARLFDTMRAELEVAYQANDVDTHTDVVAGGIPLDTEDAGVLITGSPAIGTSVGGLVGDGQGSVETVFVMANAYYDIGDNTWPVRPYIGAGVGIGFVDVDYSPSAVVIVDDSSTELAYQLMAGLSADILPKLEVFGGYRYRATTDVDTDVSLFAADLDIENDAHIVEAGVRVLFN